MPTAAIAAYKQIAADSSVEQVLRDLAALRAAALLIDAGSYDDARKLLEPLAQPGRDFRHAARELLALAAWKSGDRPGAMKMVRGDPDRSRGAGIVAHARRDADRARRGRRQELRAGR